MYAFGHDNFLTAPICPHTHTRAQNGLWRYQLLQLENYFIESNTFEWFEFCYDTPLSDLDNVTITAPVHVRLMEKAEEMRGDCNFSILHCDRVKAIKSFSLTHPILLIALFSDLLCHHLQTRDCSYGLTDVSWCLKWIHVARMNLKLEQLQHLPFTAVILLDERKEINVYGTSLCLNPWKSVSLLTWFGCWYVKVLLTCIRLSFDGTCAAVEVVVHSIDCLLFIYMFASLALSLCPDVTSLCSSFFDFHFVSTRHPHILKHKYKNASHHWTMAIEIIECTINWKRWSSHI